MRGRSIRLKPPVWIADKQEKRLPCGVRDVATKLEGKGPGTVAFNLRVYENQAKLSVFLAAVGGCGALAAIGFLLWAFDWQNFWLVYTSITSKRILLIGGALLLALGAGTVGFFIGLNSAGQKRNKLSRLSWTGFFLNAVTLTLALSAAVFCYLTKYQRGGG